MTVPIDRRETNRRRHELDDGSERDGTVHAAGVPGGRWGILRKTGGHNCGGYSCDIICNAGGQQFDVLGDQDNAAYPQWGQVLNPNPQQGCELQ